MTLSIVFPAYREAENLRILLPKLRNALAQENVDCEILVVDTMEPTDDTPAVCIDNDVRYIQRQNGNSYGDAIRTGIASANGAYIAVMDSDGSHSPDDLLRLLQTAQTPYDVVIGSRYIAGGGTHNSWILRLMSKIVNYSYRIMFALDVKDVSNSFRVYDAKKIKQIHLECDNFDLVEEILIKMVAKYPALTIKEIPIFFNKRMYGESKRDLILFILSYVKTMVRLKRIEINARRGKTDESVE